MVDGAGWFRSINHQPSTINHQRGGTTMSINHQDLRLFYQPADIARLTVENDRSYLKLKFALAAPLSRPGKYISVLDGKGEEIVLLPDLEALEPASRRVTDRELHRHHVTLQ